MNFILSSITNKITISVLLLYAYDVYIILEANSFNLKNLLNNFTLIALIKITALAILMCILSYSLCNILSKKDRRRADEKL